MEQIFFFLVLPLNIWKLEAYVRLRPIYIVEVPRISQHVAGRNTSQLKAQQDAELEFDKLGCR